MPGLFGMTLPLIQAPMAGSQGHELAAAVSTAGGLGSLPTATMDVAGVRAELTVLRRATDRPFNVNFFCHRPPQPDPERDAAWQRRLTPYYAELGLGPPASAPQAPTRAPFDHELAALVEQFRPAVVSFHFGLPDETLLSRVRSAGAGVISSATTVEEGLWLQDRGVDAVIAQGFEAGGHRAMFLTDDVTTQVGTLALVRQLVDALRVPVIAAGGIADAAGVAAALALGAEAVQVGTAYLLCPEARTSPVHRAALRGPEARHTALTNVFTGRPARGIVNRAVRELGPLNPGAPMFPLAARWMAALRSAAEAAGSGDFSPLWAGQDPTGCRDLPAAELTRALAGPT